MVPLGVAVGIGLILMVIGWCFGYVMGWWSHKKREQVIQEIVGGRLP